jgi:hypothetical protein
MIGPFPNSLTTYCWGDPLLDESSLCVSDGRRRLKRIMAITAAAIIIPAPTPTPIPAAAPGLTLDDEDNDAGDVLVFKIDVGDVFVFETDVAATNDVEYVADPVVGRYAMVLRLDGPGAGKTSSVGSEQFCFPSLYVQHAQSLEVEL